MEVRVNVERNTDGTYWGIIKDITIDDVISSSGNTLIELDNNLREAIDLYLEESDIDINNKLRYSYSFDFNLDEVRISCAGLCRIIIDDKYLVLLNKTHGEAGNKVYTPIGGGIEYYKEALEFLSDIVIKFERTTPDLRFVTSPSNIDIFGEWFNSKINREISVHREVIEELVDETNLLDSLEVSDFSETYIRSVNEVIDDNHRYFEVFEVIFNDDILEKLMDEVNTNDMLYLVSEEEIMNGLTDTNIRIGGSVKFVLV